MSYYFSEKEIESLVTLLVDAHDFVKGGPAPNLTERLAIAANTLHGKLERDATNHITCSLCENEYTYLLTSIVVKDNDHYEVTEIIVDNKYSIKVRTDYPFRSQGSIHLLFACGSGHYFIQSYDGHKGNVYLNENALMDDLELFVNLQFEGQNVSTHFNYELLGYIEKYFKTNQIDNGDTL